MRDKTTQKLYYEILEQEVRLARAVAYASRRAKPFSVWEVMIPIIFILGFMRTRQQRELFVQNFIFTKKLALRAARDQHSGRLTEQQAMERIEEKTRELLDTLDPSLYSEAIQQAQLAEMCLLMRHYTNLFESTATSVAGSLRAVYPSREAYLAFVEELRMAEADVAAAAVQTVGDKADCDMVARIDDHTHRLRLKETDRVYSRTDNC